MLGSAEGNRSNFRIEQGHGVIVEKGFNMSRDQARYDGDLTSRLLPNDRSQENNLLDMS